MDPRVVKRATIQWVSAEQGGRRSGPPGSRYIAPARFIAHADLWLVEAYSLVVELVQRSDDSYVWLADVCFMIEEAPHEWLEEGADFEMYEGRKCVARGRIEPES